MKLKRYSGWLGLLLGGSLCVVFLSRLNWSLFLNQLSNVRPLPMIATVAMIAASTLIRTFRWRLLTNHGVVPPDTQEVSVSSNSLPIRLIFFWRATVLGYLGNMIYPARAGEMLRIFYLNRVSDLGAGRIFVSSLSDRIADVLALLFIGCGLIVFGFVDSMPRIAFIVLGVVGLVFVAFFYFSIYKKEYLRNILGKLIIRLNPQKVGRYVGIFDQYIDGLLFLRSPRVSLGALGFAFVALLIDAGACWALLAALGWRLPFFAGLTLLVYLSVGACLPSAPGYLGTYQAASILALQPFGIAETGAVAYAFSLQLITLCIFIFFGGGALLQLKRDKNRKIIIGD